MFSLVNAVPFVERPDLMAPATFAALQSYIPEALVFEIDPAISDTPALCEAFNLPPDPMGNAVLLVGARNGVEHKVCCMCLATRRVDVNSVVRRTLDVRKASFASMDEAVSRSGMEYGAITPVGLPDDWPVWLDETVAATKLLCIGAGVRPGKLLLPGASLLKLPTARLVPNLTNSAS
jgi:prolyl-tRNA editing enzyme YbaK/EbsC (Cys-tRNA(Pro) deacylase)